MEIPQRYASHIMTKGRRKSKRSILLKGASGTGKTYQFRTLHDAGLKGLYVDVEAKDETIEDLDPDTWLIRALDIPLTPSAKKEMLSTGASDFILLCDFIRSGEHPYDFIYFDSLMRYADEFVMFLKHIKGYTGYDLWGTFGEKMKVMLKLLTSLTSNEYSKPVHVIATWGVEVGSDHLTGKRSIQPIVDGKVVGPRVDYYFDDVLMLVKEENAETGNINFRAYTGGTHEFSAKVSRPPGANIPAKMDSPNLHTLLTKIEEGRNKSGTSHSN